MILSDAIHQTETKLLCFHCGEECTDDSRRINELIFCCNGCKTVYELLENNNLCDYYKREVNPGLSRKSHSKRNYDFLNDRDLREKLIDFTDGKLTRITFDIPGMHCSSCIWILENLYKLNSGIVSSRTDFLRKKIFLTYSEEKVNLKEVVELLDSIGYEPLLNLDEKIEEKEKKIYKNLYYKVGIAGFCFGNIMLLSFPEYLSINIAEHSELKRIFAYLNLILSLPVFFYSSSDYFFSAWRGLKKKIVNIDVPIALGIIILFIRSLVDILFFQGPGFLDSMTGLVLFLLAGKLFQNKTYDTLNFERNYRSYFPIAVTIREGGEETTIPVEKLRIGKRIIIHNNELIPADAILIKGAANVDYSFVTGESLPVNHTNGDMLYAGGKQIGGAIEIETIKEVSQSYLTQLWNNEAFKKDDESHIVSFANMVSRYFTFAVLVLALAALINSLPDTKEAFNAFTAVLIVACPCALALSTPFALGNTLRIFGRNKFYLKNTHIIEKLASVDTIVFDKTGTITESGSSSVRFNGDELSETEKSLVKSVMSNSTHPLSRTVFKWFEAEMDKTVTDYREEAGRGIYALADGTEIKIGSEKFVNGTDPAETAEQATKVFLSIGCKSKGYFQVANKYRDGLAEIISALENDYEIALLSGDNGGERTALGDFFTEDNEMHFNQSPQNKLDYIRQLENRGKKVLMIGDGLNDAGALKQSHVGISISENTNNFSPACDGILDAGSFRLLRDFISFSKTSRKIIISSFVLSLIYNILGLGFAFQGILSPLIAAVLMPVSSISAVLFTTVAANFLAKQKGLL
ncbi:MAG: heavy metal translocating P-type ATPase metal-binding domain-containing protein [Melioribacteraceae bacterium]